MRRKILVYRDYGSANVDCLFQALSSYFEKEETEVFFTDSAEIKNGILDNSVKALFIGGGAGTPYMKKLAPLGNEKIRAYVQDGGCYFGICAGAYYACENVIFEEDIPELSIKNQCGLTLVKGNAVGTLRKEYGLLPYSLTAFSACVLDVQFEDKELYPSFYQGGCFFENHDAEVLATYALRTPKSAIIQKKYGTGKVILSGVHFEEDENSLSQGLHALRCDYAPALKNLERIKQGKSRRKALFHRMMNLI